MVEAKHLSKHFDEFVAVHDLSLQVQRGELLALLGPNGAGKTTTIRMLSAVLQPTQGWARVNGYDIVAQQLGVRRSIGLLTEHPGLYDRMSGLEYLLFYGSLYGLSAAACRARSLQLFDRFAMPDTADRRLGDYSKGMRQKVGLIRAMLHDPAVLLLDEPTSAMDPYSAKLVRDAVQELRGDKRAIILCTHNLAEAECLADRIAIIKQGQIVAEGTAVELKTKLLGRPLLEVSLDRPLNGQMSELHDLVTVESVGANSIRYRTHDPMVTNPLLVRRLMGLGLGIVSLHELPQSLEDVYLNVVTGENNGPVQPT
jgi:ABC-2 type transport system ATP-binding protein